MSEVHKQEENRKIYRVFRTTIEMMIDRGYTVPEQLRNMKFQEFISKYAYSTTEDSANEGIHLFIKRKTFHFRTDQQRQYCPIFGENGH